MFGDFPLGSFPILIPLTGAIACFLWPRMAPALGLITVTAGAASIAGLGWQLSHTGVYRHAVGGWGAPLGIDLYADGLSLLMLTITALVGLVTSVYSTAYFKPRDAARFWPLWLFLLAALNALFLSADIFNLYVTLELMGLAAVSLTALTGRAEAITGAMRYLLATLLGSLIYLLGVVLLYHGFGSLDIAILAVRAEDSPALVAALALMSTGLILKTALFPMHFWLPPAHASAPAPVSAILSALVVKASFYILLRLWLEFFGPHGGNIGALFGLLGGAAVLWGSVQALRQTQLKLLIAYSTIAQVGYLFLAFPLAWASPVAAWNAAAYLLLSHALAKAAMFLAAGNLLRCLGHDLISDLGGAVQRAPVTMAAFALAGLSITGLPPSGGFVGKWLLIEAALAQGRWDLAGIVLVGGLLAAGYVFKVLANSFSAAGASRQLDAVPGIMEWAALLLALGAIVLGFMAPVLLPLIGIGEAFGVGRAGT